MVLTRNEAAKASDGRGSDILRALVVLWLAVCAGVIVVGVSRMYPQAGARWEYAFREPSMDLDKPFASCAAAHAAGYYAITQASSAYVAAQDPDHDGLACEPGRGDPPLAFTRLKIIAHRLKPPR